MSINTRWICKFNGGTDANCLLNNLNWISQISIELFKYKSDFFVMVNRQKIYRWNDSENSMCILFVR